jgi:hypothetical protein
MLADYFTKPLQGRLFHALRAVIMGWAHICSLQDLVPHPSKERLGNMSERETVKEPERETVKEPVKEPLRRSYAEIVSGKKSTDTVATHDKKRRLDVNKD